MLIKLLPEQLVKFWDMIRFAIAETFMPRGSCTSEHLRWMLANLLSGRSQCWMGFKLDDGERKFIGFLITRITVEQAIGERVLSLDHIYAYQGVPTELFASGLTVIEEYARKNNCKSLIGLTENERIIGLSQRAGFSNRFYLYKEVPNG